MAWSVALAVNLISCFVGNLERQLPFHMLELRCRYTILFVGSLGKESSDHYTAARKQKHLLALHRHPY